MPKNPQRQSEEMSLASWASMAFAVREWLRPRLGDEPFQLVIELPRVYRASHQKGDQNDLIQLAAWFDDYNRCHPHRGLKMMSPREFRTANSQS